MRLPTTTKQQKELANLEKDTTLEVKNNKGEIVLMSHPDLYTLKLGAER